MKETHQARFARVWSDHASPLSRTISSYARPGADAEDLAQEVAMALWRALPHFRNETTERAFVLRVAHNRGLNHLWRRRPTAEASPELPDPGPGPDAQASDRQQSARLYAAIRTLPLGYRQVLTLALEDLSHAEVGATLGITPENVAVRLGRARAELRKRLEEPR